MSSETIQLRIEGTSYLSSDSNIYTDDSGAIRSAIQPFDNLPMPVIDHKTGRRYSLARDENGGLVLTEVTQDEN